MSANVLRYCWLLEWQSEEVRLFLLFSNCDYKKKSSADIWCFVIGFQWRLIQRNGHISIKALICEIDWVQPNLIFEHASPSHCLNFLAYLSGSSVCFTAKGQEFSEGNCGVLNSSKKPPMKPVSKMGQIKTNKGTLLH